MPIYHTASLKSFYNKHLTFAQIRLIHFTDSSKAVTFRSPIYLVLLHQVPVNTTPNRGEWVSGRRSSRLSVAENSIFNDFVVQWLQYFGLWYWIKFNWNKGIPRALTTALDSEWIDLKNEQIWRTWFYFPDYHKEHYNFPHKSHDNIYFVPFLCDRSSADGLTAGMEFRTPNAIRRVVPLKVKLIPHSATAIKFLDIHYIRLICVVDVRAGVSVGGRVVVAFRQLA